jgi:hypothetical protein
MEEAVVKCSHNRNGVRIHVDPRLLGAEAGLAWVPLPGDDAISKLPPEVADVLREHADVEYGVACDREPEPLRGVEAPTWEAVVARATVVVRERAAEKVLEEERLSQKQRWLEDDARSIAAEVRRLGGLPVGELLAARVEGQYYQVLTPQDGDIPRGGDRVSRAVVATFPGVLAECSSGDRSVKVVLTYTRDGHVVATEDAEHLAPRRSPAESRAARGLVFEDLLWGAVGRKEEADAEETRILEVERERHLEEVRRADRERAERAAKIDVARLAWLRENGTLDQVERHEAGVLPIHEFESQVRVKYLPREVEDVREFELSRMVGYRYEVLESRSEPLFTGQWEKLKKVRGMVAGWKLDGVTVDVFKYVATEVDGGRRCAWLVARVRVVLVDLDVSVSRDYALD